jgi:hypothetical protein
MDYIIVTDWKKPVVFGGAAAYSDRSEPSGIHA